MTPEITTALNTLTLINTEKPTIHNDFYPFLVGIAIMGGIAAGKISQHYESGIPATTYMIAGCATALSGVLLENTWSEELRAAGLYMAFSALLARMIFAGLDTNHESDN